MVRKLFVFVAFALVLASVFSGSAGATHSPGDGGPNDFVVGGGHHSVPDTQFTISVRSDPSGEDPTGNFSFKIEGDPRIRADVTCVAISGNEALVTGVIKGSDDVVVMHAVDNGNPSESSTSDLLRFSFSGFIFPDPNNPECFLPVLPPVPVTQGNIVVHDAS